MNDLQLLSERYPFLTIGRYANEEYIGIIQNMSKNIVSMYDYGDIHDDKLKEIFLTFGEEYWWSSNRKISIDIFLRGDFDIFKPYLKSFVTKEFNVLHGPVVSIGALSKKRIKRKQIQLIRRM